VVVAEQPSFSPAKRSRKPQTTSQLIASSALVATEKSTKAFFKMAPP